MVGRFTNTLSVIAKVIGSTDITFDEDARATRCDLPVYISSVPAEKLKEFPELFKKALLRIADDGIDMKRMSMVLNRDKRQVNHIEYVIGLG